MQTTLLLTLLAAAVGINAAPSLSPRLTSIPVRVYDGPGCNSGPAATTANIPTDGLCFGIAPRLTQTTSSAMIHTDDLRALPAGCTITLYSNNACNSVNQSPIPVGQCFTFGAGQFIHGAKTSGTC